jgi:outer membrane receptor protein involved in Fe transport
LKKTLLLILLASCWLSLFPQSTGSVKGVVKENSNPVEFANVFLTSIDDSTKIIASTVTDKQGRFLLEKISVASSYTLRVQILGFAEKQIIVQVDGTIDLGQIIIEPDARLLNTVEITAMRNLITKTEEGLVVKASDNITQVGGTAADLLKNMPGVMVSSEGEVTLRGRSPLVLINNRVSGIAGIDRSAQLQQIPASSIDRIEIINNPSAKYDADAEGGIINIILKKSDDAGTNGAFAVGAGLGDRYRLNASFLLNHKTDKWNFGISYDNWYTTRTRKVRGDRLNFDLPDQYFLTQRRFDERLIFYQNTKATVDFTPNKNNTWNFEILWAFPGEDNNETLRNLYQTSEREFTSLNSRHSNEIRRSHAVEALLTYRKRFANPDKLLTTNISSTPGYDRENTDITTQRLTEQSEISGDPSLQRTHTYQNTNLTNIALDYVQPANGNGTFEAGYKGIFRLLIADFERAGLEGNTYVVDPLNTNIFEFNEQIHAVYAQYTGWTGQKEEPTWKYSFGLRAEQVWNDGHTENESESFVNDYFNVFPSANLFYHTWSQNNFKLSYSRRIGRPGLGQLNPFTDITDSLNRRAGNPRLKPELIHSMELGYNHSLQKGSFSLTAFYRIRNRAILPYTILDENGVASTQPFNFGHATTAGLEAIATFNPYEFWSLNFSFSGYQLQIDDNGSVAEVSTDLISWSSKLMNDLILFKDCRLQLAGNYTSPTAIPQGETVAVYYVDVGIQQKLMKGKGRLGLVATDVFNTQKSGLITSNHNFHFSRVFKLDTRAVMLTLGYTFGTSFKEKLMENKFKNE